MLRLITATDTLIRDGKAKIATMFKNTDGATAIEYGLIAAGISVAIIAVVNGLGSKLTTTFTNVTTQMK